MSNYHYNQADRALQFALSLCQEGRAGEAQVAVAVADSYVNLAADGAPEPKGAEHAAPGVTIGGQPVPFTQIAEHADRHASLAKAVDWLRRGMPGLHVPYYGGH